MLHNKFTPKQQNRIVKLFFPIYFRMVQKGSIYVYIYYL